MEHHCDECKYAEIENWNDLYCKKWNFHVDGEGYGTPAVLLCCEEFEIKDTEK